MPDDVPTTVAPYVDHAEWQMVADNGDGRAIIIHESGDARWITSDVTVRVER